jgi:hypothetical protein
MHENCGHLERKTRGFFGAGRQGPNPQSVARPEGLRNPQCRASFYFFLLKSPSGPGGRGHGTRNSERLRALNPEGPQIPNIHKGCTPFLIFTHHYSPLLMIQKFFCKIRVPAFSREPSRTPGTWNAEPGTVFSTQLLVPQPSTFNPQLFNVAEFLTKVVLNFPSSELRVGRPLRLPTLNFKPQTCNQPPFPPSTTMTFAFFTCLGGAFCETWRDHY